MPSNVARAAERGGICLALDAAMTAQARAASCRPVPTPGLPSQSAAAHPSKRQGTVMGSSHISATTGRSRYA
ncbi:MAG: hypothetical protein BWY76_02115 [bacterium ADurb.Bin429]|nr:MAG: hypothetical protein BWY76_02115 [bacterium ADurb.Bin429]